MCYRYVLFKIFRLYVWNKVILKEEEGGEIKTKRSFSYGDFNHVTFFTIIDVVTVTEVDNQVTRTRPDVLYKFYINFFSLSLFIVYGYVDIIRVFE